MEGKKRGRSKNSKNKGNGFEREMCRKLSLWWSNGERDDLLWRSSNSGGRATMRSKKKKTTTGHYGDIAACDPCIQPLLDLCVIETKKGYDHATIGCLVDRPRKINQQTFEGWIQQCLEAMDNADSFAWMLIVKRDRREAMVYMPSYLWTHLLEYGEAEANWIPQVMFHGKIKIDKHFRKINIIGTHLDLWLKNVTPEHILKAKKEI